jgi:type II secretion system protein N
MDRRLYSVLVAAGLAVYILLVAGLAVHYRFPYHQAAQAALARLQASSPLRLTFRGPEPGLPLITKAENVDLGWIANKEEHTLFFFEKVRFRLKPLGLLAGRLNLAFRAQSGTGQVEGLLSRRLMGSKDFEIHVEEMDLPEFLFAAPGGQGRIEGRLTGRVDLTGQDRLDGIQGSGSIVMGPGKLTELNLPNMPLTELDFDTFNIDFRLEKGRLFVEKCRMEGPQGGMTLTGQVRNALTRPQLNLSGVVHMGPADKPMMSTPFRITGMADNPSVQMSGGKGLVDASSPPRPADAKE